MLFFQKVIRSVFATSLFFLCLSSLSQAESVAPSNQTSKLLSSETSPIEEVAEATEFKPEYKYYDVEIILFKHNNPSAITSEFWETIEQQSYVEAEDYDTAIKSEPLTETRVKPKLANYFVANKKFVPWDDRVSSISRESRILNKASDHIRYSKNYQLLAHLAWKQPGLKQKEAQPVDFVFSGRNQNISGKINIVLARYLHAKIEFDLVQEVCRTVEQEIDDKDKVKIEVHPTNQQQVTASPTAEVKPAEQADSETTASAPEEVVCQIEKIQFKQSRKMRSKQLHYIDHPVFGLLIQINPSELPNEPIKP